MIGALGVGLLLSTLETQMQATLISFFIIMFCTNGWPVYPIGVHASMGAGII